MKKEYLIQSVLTSHVAELIPIRANKSNSFIYLLLSTLQIHFFEYSTLRYVFEILCFSLQWVFCPLLITEHFDSIADVHYGSVLNWQSLIIIKIIKQLLTERLLNLMTLDFDGINRGYDLNQVLNKVKLLFTIFTHRQIIK